MTYSQTPSIGGNMIRLTIFMAMIAGMVFAGSLIFNSGVPAIWDSWSKNYARIQANDAEAARISKKGQDELASKICPTYFNASWKEKMWNLRDLSWCDSHRP